MSRPVHVARNALAQRAARVGPNEHQIQVGVIDWWGYACKGYGLPECLLFAIPNGGDRHPAVAGKLKAEGVRPGIPDLFLSVPRGTFHGLYVEMKTRVGKLTAKQEHARAALLQQGYQVVTCLSTEDALGMIREYLEERAP